MPKDEDLIRLRHMLDAACKVSEFIQDHEREDLDMDEKLSLSIVRLLEIIGEAAVNVSEQCKNENVEIPWRQIASTRNRLIHGYFDIDHDIVWKIVTGDLPDLIAELKKILPTI